MVDRIAKQVAANNRQARKLGLCADLTREQWAMICGQQTCHYCEGPFGKEGPLLEHITPLSRGGGTTKANVIPACRSCNSRKSNRTEGELLMGMLPSGRPRPILPNRQPPAGFVSLAEAAAFTFMRPVEFRAFCTRHGVIRRVVVVANAPEYTMVAIPREELRRIAKLLR
jgi:hypothetical protein